MRKPSGPFAATLEAMMDPEPLPAGLGQPGNPAECGTAGNFDERFERVGSALYAWARLRIRPRLRPFMDVEDLLQEVWVRGSRSFASFDAAKGSFHAWLFGIARNTLLEGMRGSARARRMDSTLGDGTRIFQPVERAASVTSVSRRMARNEAMERLLARVQSLPPVERHLFLWCGLEERTCAEAATRLGVSESMATKRWRRLRTRLKKELGDS